MIRYALTRLALLVLGLFVASALIFTTLRILPGDVAQLIAGVNSTPEQIAGIRERLGLDRPLPVQYSDWIAGILTGDLGRSQLTGTPVASELLQKAEVTVPLGILSFVIASFMATLGGILLSAITGMASIGIADSYTVDTIAAVVIGGALFSGGVFLPAGAAAGSLILFFLQSLLYVLSLPPAARFILQGTIIIAALALANLKKDR